MITDARLREMATRLTAVPGIVAVLLGGSRARGTHTPESDTDLGLYYRGDLDIAALGAVARTFAGPGARVTARGEWGPWVDGGGWLTVDDAAVDWIYRDLDRVGQAWTDASAGRFSFHAQAGHPLDVPDFSYVGEVALGRILTDPAGELAALQEHARVYPTALTDALVAGLWEADFLVGLGRKAVSRADSAYVAGCLFRSAGVCAHALHGAAGRWLINEKGAVAAAAALPGAPPRFAERVDAMFACVDGDPLHLATALAAAADLVLETADACAMMTR
ncbi:nucleotidyltransferase domain-containing protein [Actinoplanes sp. N902-109]|uniref:nucleotidyltransferase domain-containing protein n=1 Tax=Actinoplanes sp. (strain N902-109) TaxID=649831 RepID=UPI000329604F|nr:nucleotidyltransferase domain-containing protein [Actinoplanes sp. N902-109]AGL20920.1 DNA polymerase beta domain-containing protein region [Actinoplanes sp. N902-109]